MHRVKNHNTTKKTTVALFFIPQDIEKLSLYKGRRTTLPLSAEHVLSTTFAVACSVTVFVQTTEKLSLVKHVRHANG